MVVQDEEEGSEAEGEEEDEKITRNWSVLKSNPELNKSKVISFLLIIDLFGVLILWLSLLTPLKRSLILLYTAMLYI